MASLKQQQKVAQLKFLNSQLAAQQRGVPGFATPQGSTLTPAQAASAGAPVGMAAQFAPGQQPTQVVPGANVGATPPIAQALNRQQKLAQIPQNIQQALQKPAPGKGKAVATLVGGVANTPQQQQQLTTSQQARIIAREAQKVFRTATRNGSDFLSNLSTPGDVWLPVLVLLTLLFFIVPIAGADRKLHTRWGWLWLVLVGQAHVENEVLVKPTPATGATTSGVVPFPGNQIPGPPTPGLTNRQRCEAAGGIWHGINDTEGSCSLPASTSGPTGSGSVPRNIIAQPLYTGNATLGLEDYL